MIITIEDKEITLKHSFRSHIIYENITGHSFAPKGITDIVTFFYCDVMAADAELTLTFDAFIDWIDEHPDTLTKYAEWLADNNARNAELSPKSEEKDSTDNEDTKKNK